MAPIYLRVLLSRPPLTEEFLDELTELLLEGARRLDITPAVRKARG